MSHTLPQDVLSPSDVFIPRHIGPSEADIQKMVALLGYRALDELLDATVPASIRLNRRLDLGPPRAEHETLAELRGIAQKNELYRSLIGLGYHDTIAPPVILRNILCNPGWYTQYTPYQAEISQGRLEALLTFQTVVADLTGLPLANASLLDEATAAAEAMTMAHRTAKTEKMGFFVVEDCHPQTIAVVQTRAAALGIQVHVGKVRDIDYEKQNLYGILLQYPTTDGRVNDYSEVIEAAHAAGCLVVIAADLLALTLLKPPGEFGADIAVGSAQRFGVPLGFGGPHAAYMATREEYARQMPGRLIGVSKDAQGNVGYRLAVQTREQHIRRERATSNICTAQVLLAIMAGMYAVWHGPEGLKRIGQRVHAFAAIFAEGLRRIGIEVAAGPIFDTVRVKLGKRGVKPALNRAKRARLNLRDFGDGTLGVSFDEKTTPAEVELVWRVFANAKPVPFSATDLLQDVAVEYPEPLARKSAYLQHAVFNSYHAEHEMLRYLKRLESRDLSLCQSMIPLGSCTMKLNATSEMLPITWPEFADIHPFAPAEQTQGYQELFAQLSRWLEEITGFAAVSLQPNSGAAGEYTGLLVIRAYHAARGEGHRNVCLIPVSAHGTNPASSVLAGYEVVAVACDNGGNIDLSDLRAKAAEHRDKLAAIMVTYPSTHGVFEEGVKELCQIVHEHGGQVYMDGANMNAQVGLTRPADIGADVCHLNLHKTFCIPHGGGGPGMGPIAVAGHLAAYLPGHPVAHTEVGKWGSGEVGKEDTLSGAAQSLPTSPPSDLPTGTGQPLPTSPPSHLPTGAAIGPVAAAPYGSASILPISWMYIRMMGAEGLKQASAVAILNANYMAARLKEYFPTVYAGRNGRVAHEFIMDLREAHRIAGITPEDVAKRLMDYGFHAPTMSWPVHDTLMIEPTESESKAECDRLCDALIAIHGEIQAIAAGRMDRADNPLKYAPHTSSVVAANDWPHKYSREQAAFPAAALRWWKFWPPVGRIDNVWGDRNLFCTCPGLGADVAILEPVPPATAGKQEAAAV